MAEFKGLEPQKLQPHQEAMLAGEFTPYGNSSIDEGGLAVLNNGDIVEVRNPRWGFGDEPMHLRTSRTCLHLDEDTLVFASPDKWNPNNPTLGDETEISVYRDDNGLWPILPDGVTLNLPDGSSQLASELGFQPEALQPMVEYGTEVTHGLNEHFTSSVRKAVEVEKYLEKHGLVSPPISIVPTEVRREDISGLPYIQMITEPDRMPHSLEFVASMSSQLHVQMLSPEAGAASLSYYQGVQAVLTLLTQSAPARDNDIGTTLNQHYLHNTDPEFTIPPDTSDLLAAYGDLVPADWRELSRTFGSPSGGVYKTPAKLSLEETIHEADDQIRSGAILSASRILGQHTDRLRFDIGTQEISNMGRSGGNFQKEMAVKELVSKFFVAMQTYFNRTGEVCPELFTPEDSMQNRQEACDIGRTNSMEAALFGKSAEFILPDGSDKVPPQELLRRMILVADTHSPAPVSEASKAELFATLQSAPKASDFPGATAEDVYQSFYRPESPLTAAESIVLASEVEPSLLLVDSLKVMAMARRKHVYDTAKQMNIDKKK